jgi:hypothetical protein
MLPRLLAVATVAVALSLTNAGAASADVPEGWSDPDDVDFMYALLVLVGIPLLCIVVLALAVYLPSIVRGESVAPAGARATDEWFGGRRDAQHSAQRALEQRTPEATDETGGASGSW